MKPIKAIMALLAAIIILPACNEEEWENLTYEQKVIETLLKQQKPKHDIGHELVDSMRYVILKTGVQVSWREAVAAVQFGPDPETGVGVRALGADFCAECYWNTSTDTYWNTSTDTIGVVRNINTIRKELKMSDDQTLTYKGYEVVGIEDVTVKWGPIMHFLKLILNSDSEVAKISKYIESLGCRVARIHKWDYIDVITMYVTLPLERKAIPTRDEILAAKLDIEDVSIEPYLLRFMPLL